MSSSSPARAAFDHQPRTRVVFGEGVIAGIGELARRVGGHHVLLVTDAGIVAAGHAGRVRKLLEDAGLKVTVFDTVCENPDTRCVDQCVNVAREAGIDSFVGLGGGSSMDTAKGCNFILTNGGRMQDYWGVGKATRAMLPLIAVPTTSGTGSECQSFALIADESTHQKMACGDPKAAAKIAVLDPALTVSQPLKVTASTGIDAVAHAVETAVTTKRNPLSLMYSHEAFRLCHNQLVRVLKTPDDLAARANMQLGAAFAGTAIENSMLGAAHAAANPLTAHYGIVHGQAVGMMLPFVVRYNAQDADVARAYGELVQKAGMAADAAPAEALATLLTSLLENAEMPRALRDCEVEKSMIPSLAQEAAEQWTATFNPRAIQSADFERLYEEAW